LTKNSSNNAAIVAEDGLTGLSVPMFPKPRFSGIKEPPQWNEPFSFSYRRMEESNLMTLWGASLVYQAMAVREQRLRKEPDPIKSVRFFSFNTNFGEGSLNRTCHPWQPAAGAASPGTLTKAIQS
jgi:hypothetical protein